MKKFKIPARPKGNEFKKWDFWLTEVWADSFECAVLKLENKGFEVHK